MKKILLLLLLCCAILPVAMGRPKKPLRVLVLADTGGGHIRFSQRGHVWLEEDLNKDHRFAFDYISSPNVINDSLLALYPLFIQLDYPPYPWPPVAQAALEQYLTRGQGGWIGFHHPTLLGVFDGYPMWQWFSDFMGGIQFKAHIPGGTSALLHVEQPRHPVMKGVPATFLTKDEWYIYDKSPRPNVQVLASIDEATYNPAKDVKMGDHPVIWSNPHVKARNLYIAMGHFPELYDDSAFTTIFRNAVYWASRH